MADKDEKKPFALRLSKDMMENIEKWAADEFRSTNGQIEYILNLNWKTVNQNLILLKM